MATFNIIPYPSCVDYVGPEQYVLPRSPCIQYDAANETLVEKATYLQNSLEQRFSIHAVLQEPDSGHHAAGAACPAVTLLLVEQLQQLDSFRWKQEGYELKCGPQGIVITALTATGVFYGIQTLLQALQLAPAGLIMPYTRVIDAPRFIWRGVLLDAGRHFFPVPFVLKLLDLMALYKMNRFHWHLTEDQGWRLEVSSLPRLAEVAAYRGSMPSIIPLPPRGSAAAANSNSSSTTTTTSQQDTTSSQQQQQQQQQSMQEPQQHQSNPAVDTQQQHQQQREVTPPPAAAAAAAAATAAAGICSRAVPTAAAYHGGYYSMADVAAVVRYAAERCIEVVPEIELPGHCVAALAAYPHLSCTGDVSAVSTHWGIHEDVYCAGNEDVFSFLDLVFDQVVQQFPCQYVHIGGDEVPKGRWEQCDQCQARIKKEGLSSEAELQSWFVRRVSKMLAARGKRLIGWDEILEGGLAEGATVMSWRGNVGGIIAAKSGHDVIMTPTSHCYFDYRQAPHPCEPGAWYACLPLEVVYSYDPIPSPWPDSSRAAAAPAAATAATAAAATDAGEDAAVGMQLGSPGNSGDQSSMSHSCHQESTPDDGDDAQSPSPAAAAASGSTGNTTAAAAGGGGAGFISDAVMDEREVAAATAAGRAGEIGSSSPAAAMRQPPVAMPPPPQQQQQQQARRELSPIPAALNPAGTSAVLVADAAAAAGPHFPGDPPGATLAAMLPAAGAAATAAATTPSAAATTTLSAPAAGSSSSMSTMLSEDEAAHILGSQANLWCEYVQDEDTAEYMLLPRLAALAEAVWTPVAIKDWSGFSQRLVDHLPLLQHLGYKYRPLS